jgi:hypothetical protein
VLHKLWHLVFDTKACIALFDAVEFIDYDQPVEAIWINYIVKEPDKRDGKSKQEPYFNPFYTIQCLPLLKIKI